MEPTTPSRPSPSAGPAVIAPAVHPHQLEIQEFASYDLVIDARSPREFEEDHLPGAINLPVADNDEYAEVGTLHRTDTHAAYLVGVRYSLRNIARHIDTVIAKRGPRERMLVYCFRGGKRSRLWADALRVIGFKVDVLPGGWKNYRRWVRSGLETRPRSFEYRVLTGPTGCGKTRLLMELQGQGAQVLELEGMARHRGSLIGDLPDTPQPSQKLFDSILLARLRELDPSRPVWVEAESKKIGEIQLPQSLHDAMHRSPTWNLVVPMAERVRLWREDYPHFVSDPRAMVEKLAPLKPLIGGDELEQWRQLAGAGHTDALFERVMIAHYDPCYARSTQRHYGPVGATRDMPLSMLDADGLRACAIELIAADSC
jgi:tRNA 2-selenouridine synthase